MQPAPRSFRWLFVSLAVIGLMLDLGSKYGMFRWLYNGGQVAQRGVFRTFTDGEHLRLGEYDLIPGWFKFTAEFDPNTPVCDCGVMSKFQTWSAPLMPRVNHGALFGIGGEHKSWANGGFAVICIIAAIAIAVWVLKGSTRYDAWLCVALGLIFSGTLGNFYDRIVFGGVRDFLHFYWFTWPVFNFADCCLVVGAAMLLLHAVFVSPPETPPAPTSVVPPATDAKS
jgi:signal peptidase II